MTPRPPLQSLAGIITITVYAPAFPFDSTDGVRLGDLHLTLKHGITRFGEDPRHVGVRHLEHIADASALEALAGKS